MGWYTRLSRQRSIKTALFTFFLACWGLIVLKAVWNSNFPLARTAPSLEIRSRDSALVENAVGGPGGSGLSGGHESHPRHAHNASKSSSGGPEEDDDIQSVTRHRLQVYRSVCQGLGQSNQDTFVGGKMSLVFHDDPVRLGYCFVAKVGCTFWFRLLSFLTRPKQMRELGITNPLDIDRSKLHTGELGPARWQYIQDFHRVVKPSTLKFLFTRNPFERLWSVYLDKYYLIDYWVTHPIADTQCGTDVTFQMFLQWAVTSDDHHVVPVNNACEPCAFKPDFIGKMETFARDSKYLLESTGYEYLIKDYNRSLYIDSEIKSLVVYNFKSMLYSVFANGGCLSNKDMSRRLWRVFQMNGFIRDSLPFPDHLPDYSQTPAIEMFLKTVHDSPISKEASKEQRKKALVEAYSDVTWSAIQAVQERYKTDFLMFEYSDQPPRVH